MSSRSLITTIAVLIGTLGVSARAQTPTPSLSDCPPQPPTQTKKAQAQSPSGEPVSSTADQGLAADSKKAIIETGISEPYFNEHFRLVKVVDEAGDRHVEWTYTINEYETLLVDDVGYYTSPTGERVDVHSIKNELFSAYDIKSTIPRSKADKTLKSCIGKHSDAMVVYRTLKAPGKARLYLTARSVTGDQEKETDREIEGMSFNIGLVDLESGKCTIERGQVTP